MPEQRAFATCPEETKRVLAKELENLGATDIAEGYRAVFFSTTEELYYQLHLKLRTASRLFRVIRGFTAKSPEMLFSQARRIDWPYYFDVDRTFIVNGIQGDRGDRHMSSNDISKKVREAIQDVFKHKTDKIPTVDLKEPKIIVVAHIRDGKCTLSLDTTGKALHKRGYRLGRHPAPVKETLAASLLQLAEYDGTQAFCDPMCGSGTIAIEAAMIALNKAPMIHRSKGEFHLEWLKDFDKNLWRKTQDTIRAEKLPEPSHPIAASDISANFVDLSQQCALKARVEKHMDFETKRVQDIDAPAETGIMVSNLPYGERIGGETEDVKALYKEIGDTLKQKFRGWRIGLLAAEESPHKFIGLKPSKRIKIMNGSIPCKFLIFDIYAGSKKAKKNINQDQN